MKIDSFLLDLILHNINKINGERSHPALGNILYGKRNHQTWLDMHQLQLQSVYSFMYKENPQLFNLILKELVHLDMIVYTDDDMIILTPKGKKTAQNLNQNSVANIRDGRVVSKMNKFWDRLHLLVQTLSYLLQSNKKFLPIVRNEEIQDQIKEWIGKHGVAAGAKGLQHELISIFSQLSPLHREIALLRLSGVHRVSLTLNQLSRRIEYSYWHTKWEWETLLSQIYYRLENRDLIYLLDLFYEDRILLSSSCQKTWSLLHRKLTITEISQIRGLKESTIMDHIVEIALSDPNFNISPFLNESDLGEMEKAMNREKFTRLKNYKELLPHLSYFQIRLALTLLRKGEENEFKQVT